jgi:hypothetical protein
MTTPTRSKTLRAAGALIALAGAGSLASACGGDSAGATDSATVVSVLDAGEGDSIVLPVPYQVGQSASTTNTFDTTIDLSGGGMDENVTLAFQLDLTSMVTAVDDDGGSVVDSTIEGLEWIEQPDGFDVGAAEDLVGVMYSETYDSSGAATSRELIDADALTAEQRQAADEFLMQAESVAFGFPGGPVAPGATWTSDTSVNSSGVELPVTYHYELVSLDAGSYTIEVTYDSQVDTSVDGTDLAGEISGRGTITGAVDNPLALSFSFEQDVDISAGDGGQSLDMQMALAIESEVTGTGESAD